jgi:hypothetical protein
MAASPLTSGLPMFGVGPAFSDGPVVVPCDNELEDGTCPSMSDRLIGVGLLGNAESTSNGMSLNLLV